MKRNRIASRLLPIVAVLSLVAAVWAQADAAAPQVVATAGQQVNVTLHILTGGLDGHAGWPMFSPSEIVLPAHALVTMTIVDYDDGSAPVPDPSYLKVSGVVAGRVLLTANDPAKPVVKDGAYSQFTAADVAHTLTVPDLGLNIPVPQSSTVTFMFRTGAPGVYDWRCETACGTGPTGWSGAMQTYGYMKGRFIVQ